MNQYLIQGWGWRQIWHDMIVWEMEPHLFGEFLSYLNPCGGPMHGKRVLRTQQPAVYRYLGGEAYIYLRDDAWEIEQEERRYQ